MRVPKNTAKELQAVANATVKGFTPAKYLEARETADAAKPSAADVKAKLHKGMSIEELTEITGKPILKSVNDRRTTYQFLIRNGGEMAAYCNSKDIVENISIVVPGKPAEIIDVSKL